MKVRLIRNVAGHGKRGDLIEVDAKTGARFSVHGMAVIVERGTGKATGKTARMTKPDKGQDGNKTI